MKSLILAALIATFVGMAQAEKTSNEFLASDTPARTMKKKKKGISTLRQEFVDACERYAHTLISEMFVVSSMMAHPGKKQGKLQPLLERRLQHVSKAEHFFASGVCEPQKVQVVGELQAVSWRLISWYARVQEKLLYAITDMLEQNEKSCFMTGDKQKLQSYQECIHSLLKESELLVEELQAIDKPDTVKT